MRSDLIEAHAPNGRQIAFEVASGYHRRRRHHDRHRSPAVRGDAVHDGDDCASAASAYPLLVTAAAQVLFPSQANGSLIERNGQVVGSSADRPAVLRPRLFLVASVGCGQGLRRRLIRRLEPGPDERRALIARVADDRDRLAATNPGPRVPIELVTTSASGLDPHLSPAGAGFQVPRVARERGIEEAALRQLVAEVTEPRQFGILGEPRVNVLLLNLALDERYPRSANR